MKNYDVIIIGGGPAGLNAAVVLGRSRRNVILFDTGEQRNKASHGVHNYLTRDDFIPSDFIQHARRELIKYDVEINDSMITQARQAGHGFVITDANGHSYQCKKLLLATGVRDKLPALKNIQDFYGKSIFHCPYCDGWEVRDKRLSVYAKNKNGHELALSLLTWTNSVTYFTDGGSKLKDDEIARMEKHGITIIREKIAELCGSGGRLRGVLLKNGNEVEVDAMFFVNGYDQQSSLAEQVGCTLTSKKVVVTNRFQQTNVPGVYVAGDASRDMHFVVVAAAEGAKAGVTINKELQKEELESH